ncbi:ABC transporter ATP-binding protein [Candidatus Thiosymbion oneisti]|uniref:ABC transporter ATP-binding protein n=1 Tax=Candidatus Thiosymbion oneisti TaxID=589554 RepID=UPI000A500D62|nr:ATP-binding cassette domain-containing protein [Candidatus Thiosymbion oneisti]
MIEVRRLTRSYGDLKAVDDVSFDIGRSEVVGLLGHNGAGKTTVMKMLTGYLEPDAGAIRIEGLDIRAQRRKVQQRIGYLAENCPLYPEMTVIDYLDYQATLHGVPESERPAAIRAAIERTELAPKADQVIATLSRGYRQRVGVAQAILHQPTVLILDEPTNGLDPSQIQHVRTLIRELTEHATLILSTHILQEVEAVCDRVLIMHAGRLALDSDLAALSNPNRLLVSLEQAPTQAAPMLMALDPVTAVEPLESPDGESPDGRYRYALDTADPAATAPVVARAVSTAGWDLYRLQPEVRDLETLFGAVSRHQEA